MKPVTARQDVLVDVFEHIETFFRRLETYIRVPPTAGMMDIIVKIMVQMLAILAIVTKDIKQNRASRFDPDNDHPSLLTVASERFLKKMMGKAQIGDALQELDRLTQGEARMAAAESLKAMHVVDNRVTVVNDKVTVVNENVTTVHGKVVAVEQKVTAVDHNVMGISSEVKVVHDKVDYFGDRMKDVGNEVIDGTQIRSTGCPHCPEHWVRLGVEKIRQQIANNFDAQNSS